MRTSRVVAIVLIASRLVAVSVAEAQNRPAASSAPSPAVDTAAPVVAEQADRLLRQMSDYIGSAEQFTFHADISFDHVLPSGQKLQYAATEDVALERPGRLYVEWHSDLGDRQFWYDGKSITLYRPCRSVLRIRFGLIGDRQHAGRTGSPDRLCPAAGRFPVSRPVSNRNGKLQYGVYLGLNDVDGRSCHTLAFVEQDIDWQIWIDAGPQLTPCKLVITYKTQPAQPQFSAVFTDWDFTPRIAESVFTPELPPGTEKIPFAPAVAARAPK